MLQPWFVLQFILSILSALRGFFHSRCDTALEVLALRQQVAVLKRKRPRPPLNSLDRLFWTLLHRCWSRWADVLVLVKPETVVGWHRAGFRLYWRWRSRPRGGRPKIDAEVRALIRRLANENASWGAPRIHGELLKLGFAVSERTVARYLARLQRRGDPGKNWLSFLQNHREMIVALDFFTVPTVTFQLLYCFFVIEHGRRKILHCNVTPHPTAEWVVQQLREAFPEAVPYRYVILDRDSKFDADIISFLQATAVKPKQTAHGRPGRMVWRNDGWAVVGARSRPRHRAGREASASADPRIRELSSRGPHSRLAGKGHPEAARSRTSRQRTPGWFPCRAWAVGTIATPGEQRHRVQPFAW